MFSWLLDARCGGGLESRVSQPNFPARNFEVIHRAGDGCPEFFYDIPLGLIKLLNWAIRRVISALSKFFRCDKPCY